MQHWAQLVGIGIWALAMGLWKRLTAAGGDEKSPSGNAPIAELGTHGVPPFEPSRERLEKSVRHNALQPFQSSDEMWSQSLSLNCFRREVRQSIKLCLPERDGRNRASPIRKANGDPCKRLQAPIDGVDWGEEKAGRRPEGR